MLDWTECSAVERIPGKVSGEWLFRSTRVAVRALFENLEGGARLVFVTRHDTRETETAADVTAGTNSALPTQVCCTGFFEMALATCGMCGRSTRQQRSGGPRLGRSPKGTADPSGGIRKTPGLAFD
jgi:hypothetical protein